MTLRVETRIEINRPVEQVWKFTTDFRNTPKWAASRSQARQTSDGPVGVGTSADLVRVFFGRFEVKSQTVTVTEWEPTRVVAMTTKLSLGQGTMRFTFEPTPEGTRVTRLTQLELTKGARWLRPLLARLVPWTNRYEFRRLKRAVEAGSPSAPDR